MSLSTYLFGPPRFQRADRSIHVSRRNVVALASYLIVTGRPHSRESLATLFWPEHSHRAALKNLRREFARLKDALGSDFASGDRMQVGVNPTTGIWVDVLQFQRHLALVHEHDHARDHVCSHCLNALIAAADLYTDDFMAGFNLPDCPAFDEWQFFQREHLRQGVAEVLRRLTQVHAQRGQYERAVQYGQRWLALDPLHEPAQRALMRIYVQAGQQAAALRQYQSCVRMLDEELGMAPTEETTTLYEAIRVGDASGANGNHQVVPGTDQPQPAEGVRPLPPPHRLPVYPTPFVGRTQELTMLLLRLQEPACRLLTLVGPGGIGKTRLAVEASRRLVERADAHDTRYVDGIFFVPLASVQTPEGIPYAIVDALREHFYGAAPTQQKLLHYLRTKRMLLVLDNVEHLLHGSDTVAAILTTAPHVKLLVTSSQALNIQGEWLHSVGGMTVPPQHHYVGWQQQEPAVEQYDAVALFADCARRAKPDFCLDAEQEQVIRICRLVEGAPLAIELAAAWLNVLPAHVVADQLEHNLDILTSRRRDIADRHRSMRAVLEQSWDLLNGEERTVLERLAIFRGGFTSGAAESVAGATLPILADLVEKSLVRVDAMGRYQIHELLRQFAEERLVAGGTADDVRTALAAYYLSALHDREDDLRGRRQLEALAEIEADLDNVCGAWQTALERQDVPALDGALDSIYLFFDKLSFQREGAAILQMAQRHLARSSTRFGSDCTLTDGETPHQVTCDPYSRFYGRLLARLAMLQTRYARSPTGIRESLETAMAIAQGNDDRGEIAFCLAAQGHLAADVMRDFPAAVQYFQRSLDEYTQLDDAFGTAHATHLLGYCQLVLSGPSEATRLLRQALHLARQIGDNVRIGLCLAGLSMTSFFLGEYAAATAYAEETGTSAAQTGNRATLAQARALLALTYCLQGQMGQARVQAEASLVIARESSFTTSLTYALIASSTVESLSGQIREGARLADEALASHVDPYSGMLAHWAGALAHSGMQDQTGTREHLRNVLALAQQQQVPAIAVLALPVAAVLRTQQGRYDDALTLLTLGSTHARAEAGWMEAWSLLGQVRAALEAELGSEEYDAGWQRGTELDLDEAVSRLLTGLR